MTKDNIKLYNKLTIVIFSILGTTFFGAVLYSINLSLLDKRKKIVGPILFAMFFNYITSQMSRKLGLAEYLTFIPFNLIGGLVLAFIFWKEQIDNDLEFKPKQIWTPLIIMIALYTIIIGLNIFVKR